MKPSPCIQDMQTLKCPILSNSTRAMMTNDSFVLIKFMDKRSLNPPAVVHVGQLHLPLMRPMAQKRKVAINNDES